MICFACQCSFSDNTSLIRHVYSLHGDLTVYRCGVDENCDRSFSSFSSFKKHRLKKHALEITEGFGNDVPRDEFIVDNEATVSSLSPENYDCINWEGDSDSRSQVGANHDSDDVIDDTELFAKLQNVKNIETDTSNSEFLPQGNIIRNIVKEKALQFVSKLYDFPEIPRSRIQDIVDETSGLISDIVSIIQDKVQVCFKPVNENPEDQLEVKDFFDAFAKPFDNLDTEWYRFSNLVQRETLILPENYTIGEREEFKHQDGEQVVHHVQVTAQYIPIRRVFKKFFELPAVLHKTLDYLKFLQFDSNIISNFVQGSLWKSKMSSFGDKIVLPLFMYFDDYENNNPLGSHKGIGKCGAVYLSIPCLPPDFQSKLENIFLFVLFNTLDREVFKNEMIFTKVIEELKFLENEGVTITLGTSSIKLFFSLGLILGDNLGLHSILGFTESFQANFFCRFCLTTRKNINSIFRENQCTPRDTENYEMYLQFNDVTKSGIKEECIFHRINGFHVTKNLSADVMHDFLEGICPVDEAKILHHFIYEAKLFSLAELNDRIRGFYYGSKYDQNKPPQILEHYLKKNNRLAMSSAEMLCFTRHVCMILGDLVSEENEHWQLLKLLKMMVEVVISDKLAPGTHEYLATLITEYLQLHAKLFPQSMRPKHHFIVHYPKILQTVGVLWKSSSLRYESKHREGKIVSRSAVSRVNVCRTIALKHQLRLNYRLLCKRCSYSNYVIGPKASINLGDRFQKTLFLNVLPPHLTDHVYIAKWVKYRSEVIKKNSIIMIPFEEGPVFHDVLCIVLDADDSFFIVTRELLGCYFHEHSQAYKIMSMEDVDHKCLKYEDLQNAVVTYKNRSSDGFFYITKKWM